MCNYILFYTLRCTCFFRCFTVLYTQNKVNLQHVVNQLCQHLTNPHDKHVAMLKRVMRYLQYSKHVKLVYRSGPAEIKSFCDSNFTSIDSKSISISGMLCLVFGNLVSWSARKKSRVSQNTCESEILSIVDGVNEIEFFVNLGEKLNIQFDKTPLLLNDNQGSLDTLKDSGKFDRNRHYKNRINRIRRAIKEKLVQLDYYQTENMPADCLTKFVS